MNCWRTSSLTHSPSVDVPGALIDPLLPIADDLALSVSLLDLYRDRLAALIRQSDVVAHACLAVLDDSAQVDAQTVLSPFAVCSFR